MAGFKGNRIARRVHADTFNEDRALGGGYDRKADAPIPATASGRQDVKKVPVVTGKGKSMQRPGTVNRQAMGTVKKAKRKMKRSTAHRAFAGISNY
jgi:hypothetical protein